MAFSDEQMTTMRDHLGLPESADETAILAALESVVDDATAPPAVPPVPQVPEGMSLVDSAVLEQLQSGAAAGVTAAQTLADQERDRVINAALADGRMAATSREHFVTAWDQNPTSTRALIEALTPGLVPTSEIGHGDQPDKTTDDELYALVWGPEKTGV